MLPMGIKQQVPSTLKRLTRCHQIIRGRIIQKGDDADTEVIVFAYVDDIIVCSKTEEDILRRIKK